MRLAILTNWWINSDGGGVKEYTKNLVNQLKIKDIEVMVLFRKGNDKYSYKLPENKIKFIIMAQKILKQKKPEAILCQGGWFAQIAAFLYKRKYQNTILVYLIHSHVDKKYSFYERLLLNSLLNRFNTVCFVSKGLEENIRTVGGLRIKTEMDILYAGVKVEYPKKESIIQFINKFYINNNNTYLLGLGLTALYGKKEGAKLLMCALSEIIKEYENIRLILTRDGKYISELKEYSHELGLDKYIIFTGDIENPYVAINVADIYTHITYGDGLPIALLENMAFGKPIIASNLFGIPEAIEHEKNGLLVENNIESIKSAIIKLITDLDFANRLGDNAKETAISFFKWERTAEDLISIIKKYNNS